MNPKDDNSVIIVKSIFTYSAEEILQTIHLFDQIMIPLLINLCQFGRFRRFL